MRRRHRLIRVAQRERACALCVVAALRAVLRRINPASPKPAISITQIDGSGTPPAGGTPPPPIGPLGPAGFVDPPPAGPDGFVDPPPPGPDGPVDPPPPGPDGLDGFEQPAHWRLGPGSPEEGGGPKPEPGASIPG